MDVKSNATLGGKSPNSNRNKSDLKTGNRGARKNPQDPMALVQMGKGLYASMKRVSGPGFAVTAGPIVDPVQSKINKDLGYW